MVNKEESDRLLSCIYYTATRHDAIFKLLNHRTLDSYTFKRFNSTKRVASRRLPDIVPDYKPPIARLLRHTVL